MELPETLPPCRFCGEQEFVVSPNLAILWDVRKRDSWTTVTTTEEKHWGSGESSWTTGFKGGALVCTGCGHVELFMANVGEWLSALHKYPWRRTPE